MEASLQAIVDDARQVFAQAADRTALAQVKARYLGKDGAITQRMKALGRAAPADRARLGSELNEVKQAVEALLG